MAVFTQVAFDDAQRFIEPFEIGRLSTLEGITSGIENTNYFLTTDQGRFVLTLFERLTFEQLPFYLELMRHLAGRGIPVPAPQPHRHGPGVGKILHRLNGRPAAIVDRLDGHNELRPQGQHCAQLGEELARMHLAGADFSLQQPNLRGLDWWRATVPLVLPHLDSSQRTLITSELEGQTHLALDERYRRLPRGPIHADLFRDNAMFSGNTPGTETLSGIFDFYFAGVDAFLFDIAVCLNDWCIDLDTGELVTDRANTLMAAYHAQRHLTADELALLPDFLRAGALRFWISRLWDYYLPRDAELLVPHDPKHFERILRSRKEKPWHWRPLT